MAANSGSILFVLCPQNTTHLRQRSSGQSRSSLDRERRRTPDLPRRVRADQASTASSRYGSPLARTHPPRWGVDSPAPLSLSSGGAAGRSDWERGGRPPCTGSSLGSFPVFGSMPCRSSQPSSSGSHGRSPSSSSSLRPWWARVGSRSGRSPLISLLDRCPKLGIKYAPCKVVVVTISPGFGSI
jgi:hypothetical protein